MTEPIHHEIATDALAEPTPTRWSAVQVHDMATHIRTCRICGDGGQGGGNGKIGQVITRGVPLRAVMGPSNDSKPHRGRQT